MTDRPSLLVTDATAALERLRKFQPKQECHRHEYKTLLYPIAVLIDQHQRSEAFMTDIGKVIQFLDDRANKAEAKVTDLTARLEVAVKSAPDAEDQAEIDKGLAEIAAAATPPA